MNEEERKSRLYVFHILMEAKGRTLVVMMKTYHPEWNKAGIKEVFSNIVDLAYKQDKLSDGEIAAPPAPALPKPTMTADEMVTAIIWVDKEGIESKKPFKLASHLNNRENLAYDELVKFLLEQEGHKKFLSGNRFLWLMPEDNAIGLSIVQRRGRQS